MYTCFPQILFIFLKKKVLYNIERLYYIRKCLCLLSEVFFFLLLYYKKAYSVLVNQYMVYERKKKQYQIKKYYQKITSP